MDSEHEWPLRRLPTLVQLCQRAAVAHIESIYSLGEHLSYHLVKPILQRCTIKQLHRFEQSSPHLQKATLEIWKDLCFREHHLIAVERYSVDDIPQDPDSWRSRCFLLEDAVAKRLEEAGSRLRSHRMEAVERKKEREVKYTDRVPPPKRLRTGWNTSVPAKTLFQKTRSEASKLQKTIYNARVLPPMPTAKTYEVTPQMAIASSSTSSSRVTVNTVIKKRPSSAPLTLPALRNVTSESALSAKSGAVPLPTPQPLTTTRVSSSPTNTPNSSSRVTVNTVIKRRLSPAPLTLPASRNMASEHALSAEPGAVTLPTSSPTDAPQASEPPRIAKSPNKTSIRKDPMASLFVPKRKAYSQRPV